MAAAFHMAGCEATDVTMSDLLAGFTNQFCTAAAHLIVPGSVNLSQFRGLVFVGGFSYADVLDAGRGEFFCRIDH